jgi:hypothetical protein
MTICGVATLCLFYSDRKHSFNLLAEALFKGHNLPTNISSKLGFIPVGAASSREYYSGTVLPSFIAAESRSHQVKAIFLQ